MKIKNIILAICLASLSGGFVGCSDFEEINTNPNAITGDQAKPEYFLNASIIGAQQDPNIAERIFILDWKRAAHFEWGNGINSGFDNNGYASEYWNYMSGWLKNANQAVTMGEAQIKGGKALPYTSNVVQIAKIWRAYLYSEFADNFGPVPVTQAFTGVNPNFDSEEVVYTYILNELKQAVKTIDVNVSTASIAKSDIFYAGDIKKWVKYANSLRLRIAMRLSGVKPQYAQSEFEEAVKDAGGLAGLISSKDDIAWVQEKPGWDDLTGVMSRPWNYQEISATYANLTVGLGSVKFNDVIPLPIDAASYIKPVDSYLGLYLPDHLATKTNNPTAGYLFNAIPEKMDPRAAILFNLPGFDGDKRTFQAGVPDWKPIENMDILDAKDNKKKISIRMKYTWTANSHGNWGDKMSLVPDLFYNDYAAVPRLVDKFHTSTEKRVWFGPWETYFLLAEASLYGWNTGGSAAQFYESGVKASFEYHGLGKFVDTYLASTEYNRIGTSVKFDHTTEAINYSTKAVDLAGNELAITYKYPKNDIYNSGQTNNDQLTKIITQKYLAQFPWLPLEAWNDYRRLGLPFFENPAIEKPLQYLPWLTDANYMKSDLKNFPKRLRYPSSLQTSSKQGYETGVKFLGGKDETVTPLWWCKK